MSIGFVYILRNAYMPGVIKVGCTERSPRERADELSKPTGVPAPFEVHCYIEVQDFQKVERDMHQWLSRFRVSPNREFFCGEGCIEYATSLLYWLPISKSFCEPRGPYNPKPFFEQEEFEEIWAYSDMPNPFREKQQVVIEPETEFKTFLDHAISPISDEELG